ncbi:MAG: nucleoside/nucleotide kinase family protein [Pseudomonadota bacterium]
MSQSVTREALLSTIAARGAQARSLTALAGPPGAGKSTLAEALVADLNAAAPGSAAILPMDGFHYDDAILEAEGWHARKGAPHTFDLGGFKATLARLREDAAEPVAVPVFDRDLEISRGSARLIAPSVRHVVVEGNYLLLDAPGWRDLSAAFDTTVFLQVALPVLEARLAERWSGLSAAARHDKLEANDLPNARLVIESSAPAEFVLSDW